MVWDMYGREECGKGRFVGVSEGREVCEGEKGREEGH